MKSGTYIRLFFVVLIASISLILFSYSRTAPTTPSCSQENNENGTGNCEQKKSQTEFIIWESLSRNLLSINH